MILAQCFSGGVYITEEKLLDGFRLDPFFVVGCEGFFGTLYFIILLPIFQKVNCTTIGLCSDSGTIENTTLAIKQMLNYPTLLWLIILYLPCQCLCNASGVSITKFASAAQRSTISSCRSLIVWLFGLLTAEERFNWGQFCGFCLLVLGTMVYNEIFVVPIGFMRRGTEAARNGGLEVDRNGQPRYIQGKKAQKNADLSDNTANLVQLTTNPSFMRRSESDSKRFSQ